MVYRVVLIDELNSFSFGEFKPLIEVRRRWNAVAAPILDHCSLESLRLRLELGRPGRFGIAHKVIHRVWMRVIPWQWAESLLGQASRSSL